MKTDKTRIDGCIIVYNQKHFDNRGYFSRIICPSEFNVSIDQSSIGSNESAGTFRGLHLQRNPHGETKFICCVSGSADLIILDCRKSSETYGVMQRIKLNSKEKKIKCVLVPEYCASGYVTLEDNTSILYYMSGVYCPEHQCGYNINDNWPGLEYKISELKMSKRDLNLPRFSDVGGI